MKIWYDREGDFLEVNFEDSEGYLRQTKHDHVMARIDMQGRVIGFSIVGVSSFSDRPFEVELP